MHWLSWLALRGTSNLYSRSLFGTIPDQLFDLVHKFGSKLWVENVDGRVLSPLRHDSFIGEFTNPCTDTHLDARVGTWTATSWPVLFRASLAPFPMRLACMSMFQTGTSCSCVYDVTCVLMSRFVWEEDWNACVEVDTRLFVVYCMLLFLNKAFSTTTYWPAQSPLPSGLWAVLISSAFLGIAWRGPSRRSVNPLQEIWFKIIKSTRLYLSYCSTHVSPLPYFHCHWNGHNHHRHHTHNHDHHHR